MGLSAVFHWGIISSMLLAAGAAFPHFLLPIQNITELTLHLCSCFQACSANREDSHIGVLGDLWIPGSWHLLWVSTCQVLIWVVDLCILHCLLSRDGRGWHKYSHMVQQGHKIKRHWRGGTYFRWSSRIAFNWDLRDWKSKIKTRAWWVFQWEKDQQEWEKQLGLFKMGEKLEVARTEQMRGKLADRVSKTDRGSAITEDGKCLDYCKPVLGRALRV